MYNKFYIPVVQFILPYLYYFVIISSSQVKPIDSIYMFVIHNRLAGHNFHVLWIPLALAFISRFSLNPCSESSLITTAIYSTGHIRPVRENFVHNKPLFTSSTLASANRQATFLSKYWSTGRPCEKEKVSHCASCFARNGLIPKSRFKSSFPSWVEVRRRVLSASERDVYQFSALVFLKQATRDNNIKPFLLLTVQPYDERESKLWPARFNFSAYKTRS